MGRLLAEFVSSKPTARYTDVMTAKLIIERHEDAYVAYPLGLKGVVVGQGDTYEAALHDVQSAIRFHIETFGPDAFEDDQALEAFVDETQVV